MTEDQFLASVARHFADGISIGWSVEEHRANGVDPGTRGRRMKDLVPVLQACWLRRRTRPRSRRLTGCASA